MQCRGKRSNSGGRGGPWQMRFLQNPCVVEKLKQVQEVHLATEEPSHSGFSLSNSSVELWRLFPAGVKTTTACLLMGAPLLLMPGCDVWEWQLHPPGHSSLISYSCLFHGHLNLANCQHIFSDQRAQYPPELLPFM